MTRVSLVILGLLVWTSLSAADDGMYDYLGEDEDTNDVDDVSYDEDTTEALSAEGKECLVHLISDCLAENDGSAEACEGLTKQLESVSDDDVEDLCNVPRVPKAAKTDKQAQKEFDLIEKRLRIVLRQLINAYENRLKLKIKQIANKNRKIRNLSAQKRKLQNKLRVVKNHAQSIVKKINS